MLVSAEKLRHSSLPLCQRRFVRTLIKRRCGWLNIVILCRVRRWRGIGPRYAWFVWLTGCSSAHSNKVKPSRAPLSATLTRATAVSSMIVSKIYNILNFRLNVFSHSRLYCHELHLIRRPRTCANAERTFVSNGTRQPKSMIATAVSPGYVSLVTFQMVAPRLLVWTPEQFRTSSFSAFHLAAAPRHATSFGVQRTVWPWNLLPTPKVPAS